MFPLTVVFVGLLNRLKAGLLVARVELPKMSVPKGEFWLLAVFGRVPKRLDFVVWFVVVLVGFPNMLEVDLGSEANGLVTLVKANRDAGAELLLGVPFVEVGGQPDGRARLWAIALPIIPDLGV